MSSKDYLQGMPNEIVTQFDSQVVSDVPSTRSVLQTTTTTHIYVNSVTGNDQNDGYSSSRAKLTIQAAFNAVPDYIKHHTCIHLSGNFTVGGSFVKRGAYQGNPVNFNRILIDGGTDLTVIADNAGSPWTADIHDYLNVGLTTAGWTPDAYAGYMVEILSGNCSGQTRMIQGNTATTLTLTVGLSGDPDACQFRIVRPTTTLSGSAVIGVGITGIVGTMQVQNLYLTGTAGISVRGETSYTAVNLTHIVSDATQCNACNSIGASMVYATSRYNTTTFASESATTFSLCGVGIRNTEGSYFAGTGYVTVYGSYITKFSILKAQGFAIANGTRIKSLYIRGSQSTNVAYSSIHPYVRDGIGNLSAGYAPIKIGGGATGITIEDSWPVRIGAANGGVDISNNAGHGIVAVNSKVIFNGVITGANNTGAGVYASSGSTIHLKRDVTPTLTGTIGDLSTDGTTQKSTWAAIIAGTPVADTDEMTIAKEVDIA